MQAWEKFLTFLDQELGADAVLKWLRPLKILSFDAGNLYLEAENSFQISWFEEHVKALANDHFVNNNNRKIKIHFKLNNESLKQKNTKPKKVESKEPEFVVPKFSISFDTLNPIYRFENYIPSETHPLPYRLLMQITGKEQGKTELATFNPIYLWGLSGTGKTHLLVAAAHELQKMGKSVAYVHADTFTEHVVTAIRAGEMSLFRQSYRNAEVLIIDDVHLFGKKWATQEELFHTFNTLHLSGKQIMLSANCSPSELPFIEPRLISRFEWGIVLPMEQLQPAEIKKVLLAKTEALKYPLNQKVAEFLLEKFTCPKKLCRALEALMLRSHVNNSHLRFSSTQLTVTFVQQQLQDLIHEEQQSALNAGKIIKHVSEYFGIRPEDILGKAQSRDCVLPRQIAMYLCRFQLKMAFTKIGDLFEKDHSTVMSSVKVVQRGIEDQFQTVSEPHSAILKKLKQ